MQYAVLGVKLSLPSNLFSPILVGPTHSLVILNSIDSTYVKSPSGMDFEKQHEGKYLGPS
jgi:hypothetical protein